jgi:hypothetical protein
LPPIGANGLLLIGIYPEHFRNLQRSLPIWQFEEIARQRDEIATTISRSEVRPLPSAEIDFERSGLAVITRRIPSDPFGAITAAAREPLRNDYVGAAECGIANAVEVNPASFGHGCAPRSPDLSNAAYAAFKLGNWPRRLPLGLKATAVPSSATLIVPMDTRPS